MEPEPVRRIVEAVVAAALARCNRLGIAPLDFYRALRAERQKRSTGDLPGLIERAFGRLLGSAN